VKKQQLRITKNQRRDIRFLSLWGEISICSIRTFDYWILDLGSWILDLGSWNNYIADFTAVAASLSQSNFFNRCQ
jgi:hypothetical protein